MASPNKKPLLLRMDPSIHDAVQRWADDDMRSLNAQIEFLLRDALAKRGIVPQREPANKPDDGGEDE